jgi:uncharacterized membrane protein YkoI
MHWSAAGRLVAVALVGVFVVGVPFATAGPSNRKLPEKAAAAIREAFPQATITGIGRERERGVLFYEVNLKQADRRMEVEVTAEGIIGEVEGKVRLSDLPAAIAAKVRRATTGGRILRIERHEVRGVVRRGRMVPLPLARVVYEVKFQLNGRRRVYRAGSHEVPVLPEAVAAAIKAAFPGAEVQEAEVESENGVKLIEVELEQDGQEMEVLVTVDGVIIEVEKEIELSALPKPVAATAAKIAGKNKIEEAERVEVRATFKEGKPVKLDKPKIVYEIEIVKDDMEKEIIIAPDGKVVSQEDWEKDDDDDDGDDDKDDDEDDDDEDEDDDDDEEEDDDD